MKRSSLPKPTAAQIKAWQERQAANMARRARNPKPRKAIARVGRKAQRERPAVAAFREQLRERSGGWCEAECMLREHRMARSVVVVCGTEYEHKGRHAHHVWPEDRDSSTHDPARGLWLCVHAHSWTHEHPAEAGMLGLLRPEEQ
jgi:hypothetical protein